jgi:hypothetical protein
MKELLAKLVQMLMDKTSKKDDSPREGAIVYWVLFFISVLVFSSGAYNFFRVIIKHKRYKNLPMLLFYIFALLTLLGRILLFSDVFIDYPPNAYAVFLEYPIFTYICTGYC